MGSQPIGRVEPTLATSSVSESVVKQWESQGSFGDRKATGRDGTTVELKTQDRETSLIVTRPNEQPETVWSTTLEECHSLSLSRDGRMVAYVCGHEGIIVTEL
jgi:hypothetical protein